MPSGETVDDVFTDAGAAYGFGANGEAYPFDISSPESVGQAITDFAALDPSDPAYSSYLNAFADARALGYLSESDLNTLNPLLGANGLYDTGSKWVIPAFDVTNPTEALAAASELANLRSSGTDYAATIDSLNASLLVLTGADKVAVNTALVNEFQAGISLPSRPESVVASDWTQLDMSGINLYGKVLTGLNVAGSQLNGVTDLRFTFLSGLNLAGFDPTGKILGRTALDNVTGLTALDFKYVGDLAFADLRNTGITRQALLDVGVPSSKLSRTWFSP